MQHTDRLPRQREPLDAARTDVWGRASRTALLLAVLAEECDQWALVEATSAVLERPIGLDVLDSVVARGLASVEAGRVRVPRPDVRRAVTARALPSEHQAGHRAWAAVLSDDPVASAWHRTHSTQARDTEAAELALTTARALQRAGLPARAREMLEHAARLSTTSVARAACLLEAGATAYALGVPGEAQDLVDLAGRTGLPTDLVALPGLLRATFVDPAPRGPAGSPQGLARAALTFHGWGLTCLSFSLLVRSEGRPVPEELLAGEAHGSAGLGALIASGAGDLPGASRLLAQDCPRLAAAGLRGVETHARAVLAQTAARIGDLVTAANEAGEARGLACATRQPVWVTHAALTLTTVASMRGETDALDHVGDLERTGLVGDAGPGPLVELTRAVALSSADQWWDALPLLIRLANRSTQCPELLAAGLLGYLADAALHTGEVERGRELVSRIGVSSPTCAGGVELADLLYATAVLAPDTRAEACFAVVQALDPARWPWLRARADLAAGAWLRRGRRVSQARPHLLSAQRLFAALDAPTWHRRVHTELRAAGVRDPGPAPLEIDGDVAARLSPQELEIVRLAAQGLSNREIGERLFLSPRTIGSHLYRIFPKFDITSRRQLVGLVPQV